MPAMPTAASNNGAISDLQINLKVRELVAEAKVICLATASEQGCWSAPLYYLYKKRRVLFLLISGIASHPGCASPGRRVRSFPVSRF